MRAIGPGASARYQALLGDSAPTHWGPRARATGARPRSRNRRTGRPCYGFPLPGSSRCGEHWLRASTVSCRALGGDSDRLHRGHRRGMGRTAGPSMGDHVPPPQWWGATRSSITRRPRPSGAHDFAIISACNAPHDPAGRPRLGNGGRDTTGQVGSRLAGPGFFPAVWAAEVCRCGMSPRAWKPKFGRRSSGYRYTLRPRFRGSSRHRQARRARGPPRTSTRTA